MSAFGRSDLVDFLRGEHRALAADASVEINDTATGVKSVIDRTFLELGTAYSSLSSATADERLYLPACEIASYFLLRRIASIYAPKADVWTEHPSPEERRSQKFEQVTKLMNAAKKAAQGFGYLTEVDGADNMATYGTFLVDNLEPEPE